MYTFFWTIYICNFKHYVAYRPQMEAMVRFPIYPTKPATKNAPGPRPAASEEPMEFQVPLGIGWDLLKAILKNRGAIMP
jgi:hypothetical protein